MIPNFAEYELNIESDSKQTAQKMPIRSTIAYSSSETKELMNSVEMMNLKKRMEENMNNEYQEALKKNVQFWLFRNKSIWEPSRNGAGYSS